jgi:exoribonuclease R
MNVDEAAKKALANGFREIARQFSVAGPFPAELLNEAEHWVARAEIDEVPGRLEKRRYVDLPFVTLDPATSTDLDQAFALQRDGQHIILHYALADVEAFVPPGCDLEREAWRRGLTIYSLEQKVSLYPAAISQRAASLLPDGPRPAYLVTVSIDPNGELALRQIERVVCSSQAKLSYDTFDVASVAYLEAFAKRVWANEMDRGAVRVEFPQQAVISDPLAPGGVRLHLRPRVHSEHVNATLSLAVNLAIGSLFQQRQLGLFRVMDEPLPASMRRLRRSAHALGISWSEDQSLRDLQRDLDPDNWTHQQFLLEARRAGGRAKYATYDPLRPPWHSAIAGVYVHATAPMRRLADRYVLELAWRLSRGENAPPELLAQLQELPRVMERAETRAANVDRAVIDLLEAVSLQHRIGEVLEAEVVDAESGIVQTFDAAIRSRAAKLQSKSNGDRVRVRIETANPQERKVVLTALED